MKRREFIRGSMAADSILATGGLGYANDFASPAKKEIKMNILGRTGVKVSKIGYGCGPLGWDTVKRSGSRMDKDRHDLALRYVYSLPGLSTAVIGMKNMEELTNNVEAVKNIKPLSDEEKYMLSREGLKLARDATWKTVHGRPVI